MAHHHHKHGSVSGSMRRNWIANIVGFMIIGLGCLVPGIVLLALSGNEENTGYSSRKTRFIVAGAVLVSIGALFVAVALFFLIMTCAGKENSLPCFNNGDTISAVPVAAPTESAYTYQPSAPTNITYPQSNNNQAGPENYHV